jgi:uncharacterized membrane protein
MPAREVAQFGSALRSGRRGRGFKSPLPDYRGSGSEKEVADQWGKAMPKSRLEAFSDGVIAILITIMVLELKVPQGDTWSDLHPLIPVFFAYVLSFVNLGIYWNNHHHMLFATDRAKGRILWANLHLLFWLSLFPFMTGWMGENHFAALPTASYGVVSLGAALAYYILQLAIVSDQGPGSRLASAIGNDLKGKISPVLYLAAIPLAFLDRWIALALYITVALMWLVPDRRIESSLLEPESDRAPTLGDS